MVEGTGFIEAKLRGRDTTEFLQVRQKQVNRILTRSPLTRLLLYDYNAVGVLDAAEPMLMAWPIIPTGAYAPATHGPIMPLQLAATIARYDHTLYRFCHPFSHQFSRRYFQLHDLDFSPAAVGAVKGFPAELGTPRYSMVISMAPVGQELPGAELNGDLFGIVE